MNITSGMPVNTEQMRDSFTDLNSLNAIKKMGRNGDEQALKEVAKQFEALFVQQLLKTMRATEDVFSEGNYDQSSEMKFHRDLMDQQMSLELTKGTGLGLADALFNQMKSQYAGQLESKTPNPAQLQNGKKPIGELRRSSIQVQPAASIAVNNEIKTAPVAQDVNQKITGFVDQIFDVAKDVANTLGVKVDAVIAQAALETGWGEHTLTDQQGNSSFNFFNIKAGSNWQGDTVNRVVKEYDKGLEVEEAASFRAYPSIQSAFSDFASFLADSPRYKNVVGQTSSEAYGKALQGAGYATDPNYAEKIQRIATNPILKNALARKLL